MQLQIGAGAGGGGGVRALLRAEASRMKQCLISILDIGRFK